MKENKYYTPDLEDLFVGYECEIENKPRQHEGFISSTFKEFHSWDKFTISEIMEIQVAYGYFKRNEIRVPYLTREQIMEELYILDENSGGNESIQVMHNDTWFVDFYPTLHKITLYYKGDLVYNGRCRCVNDLRKITRVLGDDSKYVSLTANLNKENDSSK